MSEFHRQQSKVWWSSFHEEGTSRDVWPRGSNLSCPPVHETSETRNDEPVWGSPDMTTDRGDSSSPSQGSHGSQDSGFSDSELHHHDSPDLSQRPTENLLQPAANHPPTPATSRSIGSKVLKFQVVEFSDDKEFLEVDANNSRVTTRTPPRDDSNDKINQIQNQLELTSGSKLPKKTNSPQGKVASLINQFQTSRPPETGEPDRDGSISSLGSCNTVIETSSSKRTAPELDRDGFKIPKCIHLKGSFSSLLNFGDNPPVSCSTPKAPKVPREDSPTEFKTAQTKEKISCRSTLATVRKLKGLAEHRKSRPSIHLQKVLDRCGIVEEKKEKNQPVIAWLTDLESLYEAEIMTTLQSKSLATDLTRQVTHMAAATSETIRRLHETTKLISKEFSRLSSCLKCKKWKQVPSVVQSLVGYIKDFMTDFVNTDKITPATTTSTTIATGSQEELVTVFREEEADQHADQCPVADACQRLNELTTDKDIDYEAVEKQQSHLALEFRTVVDKILLSHIQALVHVLEDPRTELALRTALSALCALGLEGSHLAQLMSECGGVRALLAVCLEARATAVRVSALRALATVCCLSNTIRQFENAGGVEIIADIISDHKRVEAELTESAAVLAQITAPWIEDNHSVAGLVDHLPTFVSSLTHLISAYKSSESLLLTTAALANLTFMEPRTVWSLLEYKTAGSLLSAVRKQGPKVSVFIQEQAATILANMAAVPECRQHLAEHRAVVALLCFLQIQHSPLQRIPEQQAAERVQQKSAIALSRLCSDALVARQVVELQGVTRLVRLCKEERERNHSDGVLVACLAALRKIVANCGLDPLNELSAAELVQPKLLDSFLLYSSRQESYV